MTVYIEARIDRKGRIYIVQPNNTGLLVRSSDGTSIVGEPVLAEPAMERIGHA